MTLVTLMTVIYGLILDEALLPLTPLAGQVLNLDALGPEHRSQALEMAAEVLGLLGPGLEAADVVVHAHAKLLEQFHGSTYPLVPVLHQSHDRHGHRIGLKRHLVDLPAAAGIDLHELPGRHTERSLRGSSPLGKVRHPRQRG